MQTILRYPIVTCPGCKRPMLPSPPLPVSVDTELCDVTYTCAMIPIKKQAKAAITISRTGYFVETRVAFRAMTLK